MKSPTVLRGVEKFWRILEAKFEVLLVKSATVERGVDQFWRIFAA